MRVTQRRRRHPNDGRLAVEVRLGDTVAHRHHIAVSTISLRESNQSFLVECMIVRRASARAISSACGSSRLYGLHPALGHSSCSAHHSGPRYCERSPAGAIAGFTIGAGAGLAGHAVEDILDGKLTKSISGELLPGSVALILEVKEPPLFEIEDVVLGDGGKVFHQPLAW
ncbi:hypothetical protein PQR02_38700 [Paraburkholderia sediminicola]|uniref:Uncharacterized protein n=1 Tax=Paraburkholderia rhynchosiae TaxID=487049 RepID=A0ACC7NPH8_9BURK